MLVSSLAMIMSSTSPA